MATAAATSSSILCKTLSQPKSLQGRTLVCSFSHSSKPFSLVEPLAVLASSCSISPLVRKARPFELGFVTRVVMSDLDTEQDEEGFEEEEDGFDSEDSYEEESDGEVAQKDEFEPNSKLFVGNLPFSVDSAQLAGVFGEAGNVEMVEVIYDKITGRSRGFGFVTMGTAQEATSAAKQLDGFVLEGREIRVRSGPPPPKDESTPLRGFRGQGDGFRGGAPQGDEYRVHVGNLSWGVDNSTLNTLFSEQGRVLEAKVIYDRESGRSRGFGFVTYGSAEEVENAIASLNGADLDGRSIRVSMAEARPPRRQNFF